MIELKNKAEEYATGKLGVALDKVIAQAYVDGYRDGYQDCEKEVSADLRFGKTDFVDLGLKSKTLWSADYEPDGEEIKYLPYDDAARYSLPTKEQFKELLDNCHWEFRYVNSTSREYTCIGPNGNHIVFHSRGYKLAGTKRDFEKIFFWIKSDTEDSTKEAVYLYYDSKEIKELTEMFSGNMLPLRLVRK